MEYSHICANTYICFKIFWFWPWLENLVPCVPSHSDSFLRILPEIKEVKLQLCYYLYVVWVLWHKHPFQASDCSCTWSLPTGWNLLYQNCLDILLFQVFRSFLLVVLTSTWVFSNSMLTCVLLLLLMKWQTTNQLANFKGPNNQNPKMDANFEGLKNGKTGVPIHSYTKSWGSWLHE